MTLAGLALLAGCAEGTINVDALCGDGHLHKSEACDDGNREPGDGCDPLCAIESGYLCSAREEPSICVSTCGDSAVDENEECDGSNLNGESCQLRGETHGALVCTQDCVIDSAACSTPGCDNGVVDAGETCDDGGTEPGDGCDAACAIESGWACSGSPSTCAKTCGNAALDDGEECDGDLPADAACADLAFIGGTLTCKADCSFDTTACVADRCGNAFVGPNEECDDGNEVGVDGCSVVCTVETGWLCEGSPSDCRRLCGNEAINEGEACDGLALGDETCEGRGFDTGTLACTGDCTFDTSGCRLFSCGNGALETGEDCDGAQMGPETCLSLGMLGGTVQCTENCGYDLSQCIAPSCGDGVITAASNEMCDDNNTASSDGCNVACQRESGWACTGEPSVCTRLCGNDTLDGGEACDGTQLGTADCASQGFAGGVLGCASDCTFDTAACLAAICDNGTREPGEECDGQDLGGKTCDDYGFPAGSLSCSACAIDASACLACQALGCVTDQTPNTTTCAKAKVVGRNDAINTGGAWFQGDTTGDGNNDDLSTNSTACWDGRDDNFYRFYLRAGDAMEVTLFPLDVRFNAMLKLYEGVDCDANGSGDMLFCTNGGGDGGNETFTYTATTEGWHTVVVDGRMAFNSDNDWGPYNIRFVLTCGPSGCCCS